MTGDTSEQHPIRRAAQRFVLVTGAGALGAVICAGVLIALGSTGTGITTAAGGSGARQPSPHPLSKGEEAAVALLRDAAGSAAAVTFQGRKTFSSWTSLGTTSVLAEVRHEPGHGTRVRVTSAGSASDAEQVAPDAAPHLTQPDDSLIGILTSRYTLRVGPTTSCAGRPAVVVEATAARTDRVAGRFWVDRSTGVLLRHEVYDDDGRQVWMSAFLDLTVDATPAPSAPPVPSEAPPAPPAPSPLVGRTPTPFPSASPAAGRPNPTDLEALRRRGWSVPAALPGGLALYRATEMPMDGGTALHLTYLDGLFSASVFAQRGRLDDGALRGFSRTHVAERSVYARQGLYRQYVWSGGDTVYTLVTDASDDVVSDAVAALPHGVRDDGLLSRMGRGADRMGSWMNPFH